ncbi:MAG TPA: hypothetical protein DEG43_02125 [Acidimicrobiaceae bacterium]|nr:hypothetical protein [Acidimicrobiaceae bacterium]
MANVEQIAEVRRPELIGALVVQLAARSANEVVVADLAKELMAGHALINAYLDVLATLYLVRLLPAWTTSLTNRSKRRPVAQLIDTALAAHLVGQRAEDLSQIESPWFGPLLESYAVGEIAKQAGWSEQPITLSHYRDRDQRIRLGDRLAAVPVSALWAG